MKFGIFDHVERLRNIPLDRQYSERLDLLAQADKGEIYGYHVADFSELRKQKIHLMSGPTTIVLEGFEPSASAL